MRSLLSSPLTSWRTPWLAAALACVLVGISVESVRAQGTRTLDEPKADTPKPAIETVTAAGSVTKLGAQSLTIDQGQKGPAAFRIAAETRLEINGKPAELRDLRVGDPVRVIAPKAEPDLAMEVVVARVVPSPQPEPTTPAVTPRPQVVPATTDVTLGAIVAGTPGDFVQVVDLTPNGPAAMAGILIGDFILSVDAKKPPQLLEPQPLHTLTPKDEPGEQVVVAVWRGGRIANATLTLVPAIQAGEVVLRADTVILVDGQQVRLGDVVSRVDGTVIEPGAELVVRRRGAAVSASTIPPAVQLEVVVRHLAREVAALRAQLSAPVVPRP